jgi:hypothetical protein
MGDYYVCYTWEMVLNLSALMYHMLTCRTGKQYRRNQGKLVVWKLT